MMTTLTCRTCLAKGRTMKSLYALGTIYGKTLHLRHVLAACATLQISLDDGLPQHICLLCVHQMEKAYSFRMTCEKNEKYLLQQMNIKSSAEIANPSKPKVVEIVDLNDFGNDNHEIKIYNERPGIFDHLREDVNPRIGNVSILKNHFDRPSTHSTHSEVTIPKVIKILDTTFETNLQLHINEPKVASGSVNRTLGKVDYKADINPKQNVVGPPRFNCKQCKRSFKFKSNLDLHYSRDHLTKAPSSESLICEICDKKCASQDHYNRHMNHHKTGKEYHCDICGRDFAQQRTFVSHTYSHTGERPFLCTECGKTFKQNVDLKVHMRVHLNLFPYECTICDKKFRYSSRFAIHKRRHAGHKPFSCPFCDKSFFSGDRLAIHKRVHTGEKPFVCKICSKGFARSSALKVHSQTHTGEKPHICLICNKGFSQAHCLRSHMKLHEKHENTPDFEKEVEIATESECNLLVEIPGIDL